MDYNKKILQFFTNELSPDQRNELVCEAANNPSVDEDIKLQQEVLFAIANEQEDHSDFRSQLSGIGQEFLKEKNEVKSRSFKVNYWLAAASIVVVLGLGGYLGMLSDSNYNGGQAFNEFYSPYGSNLTVRGNSEMSSFNQAFEYYNAGEVTKAIEEFQELSIENEELAGFYLGLCKMELGDFNAAKEILLTTKKEAIFYEEQIRWYLSLCHLKLEEYDDAELLLTQLMTSGSVYKKDASELLKKLDY